MLFCVPSFVCELLCDAVWSFAVVSLFNVCVFSLKVLLRFVCGISYVVCGVFFFCLCVVRLFNMCVSVCLWLIAMLYGVCFVHVCGCVFVFVFVRFMCLCVLFECYHVLSHGVLIL